MRIYSVEDLGKEIRIERKRAGLTQRELARACRVGVRFISDLENVEFARALLVTNVLSMDLSIDRRGA